MYLGFLFTGLKKKKKKNASLQEVYLVFLEIRGHWEWNGIVVHILQAD